MTHWVLKLSLTNRPSVISGENQLNYSWTIFDNSPLAIYPPVMKVNDTVAFSLSKFGPGGIDPATAYLTITASEDSPFGSITNEENNLREGDYWWPTSANPGVYPINNVAPGFKFRVTVKAGGVNYTVDPEMVVEDEGPPLFD